MDSLKIIPGMTSISLNVNKEKTNVILGREVINLWGQPLHRGLYRRGQIPDLPVILFPGEPGPDRASLRKSPGIRRPYRRGDGLGPLLRYRHDLPLPGPESQKSLRRGDHPRRHRRRPSKCLLKPALPTPSSTSAKPKKSSLKNTKKKASAPMSSSSTHPAKAATKPSSLPWSKCSLRGSFTSAATARRWRGI